MTYASSFGRVSDAFGAHFVIEGVRYDCAKSAFGVAKSSHGYTGTLPAFAARLAAGATTWAVLAAPMTDLNARRSASAKETRARKKAEMAAVIAELDARKAKARA